MQARVKRPGGRVVALAGATGLVGQALLRGLLDDRAVASVHALGRRRPDQRHPKLVPHTVDFAALPPLPPLDEVYLALGTTIRSAGSEAAFRAVDFDANLAVARAARAAGARRAGLVSAMGADARSRIFYSRTKGELEAAVAALGFEGLVIARPSLLLGDRSRLGQAARPLEELGRVAGRLLGRLVPRQQRPIEAGLVAAALLLRVPTSRGRVVLLSGDMQR
ncbi:MAG: hypothetical protein MUC71_13690 [Steroidobacteraceae bacterium]|jgi:uncharacterized protein YbjT (DUF2867 family)|nr:hypothetical protein [Steroidobacteraceae bacterium]